MRTAAEHAPEPPLPRPFLAGALLSLPALPPGQLERGSGMTVVATLSGVILCLVGLAMTAPGRYAVGRAVTVACSPADPERSTLEPGLAGEAWTHPAAGAASFLFGLAVLLTLVLTMRGM